jgi:hypothetical protein
MQVRKFVRAAARVIGLLASAAAIAAVSHVNMAVAGIGGISGRGQASLSNEETGGATAARAVAALSVVHLQEAIENGKSEAEIKALAHEAGYNVVIT